MNNILKALPNSVKGDAMSRSQNVKIVDQGATAIICIFPSVVMVVNDKGNPGILTQIGVIPTDYTISTGTSACWVVDFFPIVVFRYVCKIVLYWMKVFE